MKGCIGFIIDLSKHTKRQLQGFDVNIQGDTIASFLPFMNLISNMINDKYDVFIGACGVDTRHGQVCDIILLLQYLSNHEWLPIVPTPSGNTRRYKNAFIRKLKDAGAENISNITEVKLSEHQCQYLMSAFQNFPNIYYEIGYIEYQEFHKDDSDEYFKLHPQAKKPKSEYGIGMGLLLGLMPFIALPMIVSDAIHNRDMLNYIELTNDQYKIMTNKVLFGVLRQFDWKTCPKQFLLFSPNEIVDMISRLYARSPPQCKNSIVDAIKTFFFESFPYLDRTLTAAYETLHVKKYLSKNLIIISNGTFKQNSQNPLEIVNSHQNEARIICCYLSQNKISNQSKQLYFNCPSDIDDKGRRLFLMSSLVQINFTVINLLERRGWIIPKSGMCRLFVHINDPNLIQEFIAMATEIIQNNDVLSNVLGTTVIQKYVSHNITSFPTTNQHEEPICWSHACATVIHMSIARITGRRLPEFVSIRDTLLDQFGRCEQNVKKVLDKILYSRYKLHYKIVDEKGAKEAIIKLRPCVASFHLTALQWYNFSRFFRENKTGILTSEIINEKVQVPKSETNGGHAVVLVDFGDGYLTFLNSWGNEWADNGRFRIKDSSVLGGISYFDIFWYESDLSPIEKKAWSERKTIALTDLIWNQFQKSPETKMICPHCQSSTLAKSYYGDCSRCVCPVCFNSFSPTIEYLSKNLIK